MAKKQISFAEKTARVKSTKDWKTIKYVKSERSEKTDNWRFNESFIQLASNENLDQALSRMEQEVKALAEKMKSIEDTTVKVEESAKTDETKAEKIASIEESTVKAEEKVEVKVEESAETDETKTEKINTSDQVKDFKKEQPAKKT
jgi:hypothetical protein